MRISKVRNFGTYLTQWLKNFHVFHQSLPHPATKLLLWTSISCVSQATSCRVCCGMASAPAPDGSAGLCVILSNSIVGTKDSLLRESVRRKGAGAVGQSVYAHGSHREERHKLFCSPSKTRVSKVGFLSICLHPSFGSASYSSKLMHEPADLMN